MRKNFVQAQPWVQKCYPDSAQTKTPNCRWYAPVGQMKQSVRKIKFGKS